MDLLILDAGSEFKKEVTNVCNALAIQQKYTAAHRAMGHGVMERVNRTVTERIKAFAKEGKWCHRLQWAKLAYNSSVHRALSEGGTEMTPAAVHLGRQLRIPLEGLSLHKPAGVRSTSEYAESIRKEMIEVKEYVIKSRAQCNSKMREQYEKSHIIKDRSFEPGDTVWVRRPTSEAPRNQTILGWHKLVEEGDEEEQRRARQLDEEGITVSVHVECKHGFALIRGMQDDTLKPACTRARCKEDGEHWLKREGLIAHAQEAESAASDSEEEERLGDDWSKLYFVRQAKVQQTPSDPFAGDKHDRPQGCLNPFCNKKTCQEKGKLWKDKYKSGTHS